jgi:hypothetical protein
LEFVDGKHFSIVGRQQNRRLSPDLDRNEVERKLLENPGTSIYDVSYHGDLVSTERRETAEFMRMRSAMYAAEAQDYQRAYLGLPAFSTGQLLKGHNSPLYEAAQHDIQVLQGGFAQTRIEYFAGSREQMTEWLQFMASPETVGQTCVGINGMGTLDMSDVEKIIGYTNVRFDNLMFTMTPNMDYLAFGRNPKIKVNPQSNRENLDGCIGWLMESAQACATIEQVAQIHWKLENLHPFHDNNTRINHIFLQKVLQDKALGAGVIFPDPMRVHFSTPEQWVAHIEQGIKLWNTAEALCQETSPQDVKVHLLRDGIAYLERHMLGD